MNFTIGNPTAPKNKLKLVNLVFILVLLLSSSFYFPPNQIKKTAYKSEQNQDKYVYICLTKSSYAYHYDKNCHALNRCKGEKKKILLSDAKNKYKRKICGFED